MRSISITVIAVAVLCLIMAAPAFGVIWHPDGEPDVGWTDKPHDDVVGRWSTNASFVVIDPNWIVTTTHQGKSPSTVVIAGITYNCNYNDDWKGGESGSADIRLVRLTAQGGGNANLANYVEIYTSNDESGKDIVMGGYGRGRETILQSGDPLTTYGYTWGTEGNDNNNTRRWCTNKIDGVGTSITADFDGLGEGGATAYEGSLTEYDSGGGWFIEDSGVWYLAGLTTNVDTHGTPWPGNGESWFRNRVNPDILDPDTLTALRIYSQSGWINETIPEPGTMILLSLGAMGMILRRRRGKV